MVDSLAAGLVLFGDQPRRYNTVTLTSLSKIFVCALQDVEKELELQMSLKNELEVAMRLLEKDIYDKQDGLITLREQLDNVKAINLDIYKKLQVGNDLFGMFCA